MSRDDEEPAGSANDLDREPDSAEAWNNRALSLHKLHRYEEAIASFNRAIELKPALAEPYNNRGITRQEMGRYDDALADYDKAIELKPQYANAHNNRGAVLSHLRRFAEALTSCDTAIGLRPNFAEAYHNRGTSLHELARYEAALESYDKALVLKPDSAETHANRGVSLHQLKRIAEALASCARALALKPDYAEPYQTLGLCLADQGEMEAAETMYLKALELKPDFPESVFSLTEIRKYKDRNHPDVRYIQSLLDKPGISYHGRECLYFALGKIYDDCGLYDDAFESYRQGNQMRNTAVSYNAEMVSALTEQIIEVFNQDFNKDWTAQRFAGASDSQSPLFIVGMPRSGTTLLTQILSNHRSIGSAGELPTIVEIISALPKSGASTIPYPQAAKHLDPAIAAQFAYEYEKRLRRDTGSEVARVIDKHPLNFAHLGFISMLFPDARIIHCVRHPLDTALSNYFQRFSFSYNYSFDLRNIGHYYGEYSRIMEHWRSVLPATMIEVSYEDMIANTEQMARRILTWLDLEWDERCLAPHTNRSLVDSASKWQVRQPIYHRSVGRWRHYEKHLGPMKQVLRTYQVPFDEDLRRPRK